MRIGRFQRESSRTESTSKRRKKSCAASEGSNQTSAREGWGVYAGCSQRCEILHKCMRKRQKLKTKVLRFRVLGYGVLRTEAAHLLECAFGTCRTLFPQLRSHAWRSPSSHPVTRTSSCRVHQITSSETDMGLQRVFPQTTAGIGTFSQVNTLRFEAMAAAK
jgi:hypothetical protein